jgi:hypothetical protein
MVRRFAMQSLEILWEKNPEAACNQSDMRANANRCRRFVVCQSLEKSDHDYALMAHDDCFKNSRTVIPSPNPPRETPNRSLNSPLVRFLQ